MVHQLRLYKISLYSEHKDATIKDLFKFKIQFCFKSLIIKHWTPYTKHLVSFLPIPLTNWEFLTTLAAQGGELKMFFELENQRNNMWKFNLIWVLKCLLTELCKNSMCNNYLQSSSTLHCALCLTYSGFEKTIPWEFVSLCLTKIRWPGRDCEAWLREIAGAHTRCWNHIIMCVG